MAYHFQISAKILTWPRSCACCNRAADTHLRAEASRTTGKRVQRTTTSWWQVPYCSACIDHNDSFESASIWLGAGLVVGVISWVAFGFATGSGVTGFFLGSLLFLASLWPYQQARAHALSMMSQECAAPSYAVRYIEWHGTVHTFVFFNAAYLESFLLSNDRKHRSDVKRI